MKEFWTYTLARFALLFATWGLVAGIWALVNDGDVPLFWPLLIAAVVSMALSTVLLRGLRERFVTSVQQRASSRVQADVPGENRPEE